MSDTYTPRVLLGVVDGLIKPSTGLLGRYYPTIEQSPTEVISFDVILKARRIAPFVSPLVPGRLVKGKGFKTQTFSPAYIKDKRRIDPNKALKRAAGEPFGANWSPAQRRDALIARELEDSLEMIDRRLEVMAAQGLRTGKVVVAGEDYEPQEVDFLRDPTLLFPDLAGTERWTDAASKPLKFLRAMQKASRQKSGANPADVIMGDDALEAFLDHATVQKRLDTRNVVGAQLAPGTEVVEGLTFHGVIDRMNIFSYSGWYEDPVDGQVKEIWPAKAVTVVSSAVQGIRAFGAIQDVEAGLAAVPVFPKMWVEKDPSAEILLVQSAPLMVPQRPDATASCENVLG